MLKNAAQRQPQSATQFSMANTNAETHVPADGRTWSIWPVARSTTRIGRSVGRRVRLEMDVDEKILGGFVARVGSEVFDASVRRAVEQFRERIKEGAGT